MRACIVAGDVRRQGEEMQCPGDQPLIVERLGDAQTLLAELARAGGVVVEVRHTSQSVQDPGA